MAKRAAAAVSEAMVVVARGDGVTGDGQARTDVVLTPDPGDPGAPRVTVNLPAGAARRLALDSRWKVTVEPDGDGGA